MTSSNEAPIPSAVYETIQTSPQTNELNTVTIVDVAATVFSAMGAIAAGIGFINKWRTGS